MSFSPWFSHMPKPQACGLEITLCLASGVEATTVGREGLTKCIATAEDALVAFYKLGTWGMDAEKENGAAVKLREGMGNLP